MLIILIYLELPGDCGLPQNSANSTSHSNRNFMEFDIDISNN